DPSTTAPRHQAPRATGPPLHASVPPSLRPARGRASAAHRSARLRRSRPPQDRPRPVPRGQACPPRSPAPVPPLSETASPCRSPVFRHDSGKATHGQSRCARHIGGMTQETDVIIAGGGLNGPALALALAQAGLSVTVVD